MQFDDVLRTRRSHKQFSGAPMERELLETLVELATWAPNHKVSEPWRFTIVTPPHFPLLLDAMTAALGPEALTEKGQAKIAKGKAILLGAGGIIALRQVLEPGDAVRQREDYAACACAMQNMQLAAWARGWGSFWTTSEVWVGPRLAEFWHVGPEQTLVGALVFGRPALTMPAIRRLAPQAVTTWVGQP